MVYSPGSHSGKWSAFVEPITSRRQIFHLVKNEPPKVEDGKAILSASYEVELVFHKLENGGDWGPSPPTMISNFSSSELQDFMQAIVDEAAKLGIVASGHQDATAEIKRIEHHLEDMRKLVFQKLTTQPS